MWREPLLRSMICRAMRRRAQHSTPEGCATAVGMVHCACRDVGDAPVVPRLMSVRLHPHAVERLVERGATETEVIATVEGGETYPAKFGRTGFRRNFSFQDEWRGRRFAIKQVEAYAAREGADWLVISFVTRYF